MKDAGLTSQAILNPEVTYDLKEGLLQTKAGLEETLARVNAALAAIDKYPEVNTAISEAIYGKKG